MTPEQASTGDLAAGLADLADLVNAHIASWHDFGYANPPAPECSPIPPLGERSARAISAGYLAVKAIDELLRQAHALRGRLVSELRQDSDIREVRIDAQIAEWKTEREARKQGGAA